MTTVAVDARTIYAPRRRGTGKNLIDVYRHLSAQRPDWRFVLFHRRPDVATAEDPFSDRPNVEPVAIDCRGDRWNLWMHWALPRSARRLGADVLHCPANVAPATGAVPLVVTIHDLIPIDFRAVGWRRWRRQVARSARRARRIVTPSDYTRHRLVAEFGVDESKIAVNPWAPDDALRRIDDPAVLSDVRQRYAGDAGRNYVLAFGGRDPRKNVSRITAAYGLLPADLRERYALVIVGDRGETAADRTDGVRIHGFAPEADLPALISAATVLCYASLSEGFGLPILDAFRCGTAVVAGDVTSMPDVAGDAALLVDPRDTGAIAEAIGRLLRDDALRQTCIERGTARSALYRWDACAERLGDVLTSAADMR